MSCGVISILTLSPTVSLMKFLRSEHLVPVEYFHPEHCPRQYGYDFSLDFYGI